MMENSTYFYINIVNIFIYAIYSVAANIIKQFYIGRVAIDVMCANKHINAGGVTHNDQNAGNHWGHRWWLVKNDDPVG